MKKKAILISSLFFLLICIIPVQAHSGRTDSRGGHHDYKNKSGLGSYHYHHGFGPHLHPGGVCPYSAPAPVYKPKPAPQPTPKPVKVFVNDKQLYLNTTPIIDSGTTLVPLRPIMESMGATIGWDQSTKTVIAVKENIEVILPIGSTKPTINGVVKSINVPGKIVNGTTLVPVRFIGDAFGAEVKWDDAARTITINM